MLFLLSFLIVFVPFILVLIYYFPIVAITTTSSMAANNTNILCLSSEKSEVKNQPHCVKTKVSAGLCSLFQSGSVEESTSLLFPTIRDYLHSLVQGHNMYLQSHLCTTFISYYDSDTPVSLLPL